MPQATTSYAALMLFLQVAKHGHHSNEFLHLLFSFGVFGLFFISVVDSSFVPLPIPGVTDIMLVVFAAQNTNVVLLVVLATAGSALGGYLSYQVGQSAEWPFWRGTFRRGSSRGSVGGWRTTPSCPSRCPRSCLRRCR